MSAKIAANLIVDRTRAYYEGHADEYFRATHATDLFPVWDKLTKRLQVNASILDLGCGSGRDVRYFASRGFRPIGLDYSFNLLKLAMTFSNQPTVLADMNAIPFGENIFDAAWSIGSLLHVPRSSISTVLSQIRGILKPQGFLLSSLKKGHGEEVDPLGRFNVFYQPNEWADVLQKNGFRIIELEETTELREVRPGEFVEIIWITSLGYKA